MKIENSEFWGNYEGHQVYKCFDRNVVNISKKYPDLIFASGKGLYRKGYRIGSVNEKGQVSDFDYDKPDRETVVAEKKMAFEKPVVKWDKDGDVDTMLRRAMTRSIDDLVGEKLSN